MRRIAAVLIAALSAAPLAVHAQQGSAPVPPAMQSGLIDQEAQPYHGGPTVKDFVELTMDAKPVYAVISGRVVSGEIRPGGRLDALRDASQPGFACQVFQRKAQVRLSCNDGAVAEVALKNDGCGASRAGQPSASLCVGWAARAAVRRLTAPAGHVLAVVNGSVALKPLA